MTSNLKKDKMETEFNLSEKIRDIDEMGHGYEGFSIEDVKEFIKRLKDKIEKENWDWNAYDDVESHELRNFIDKLSGDKLI